jgi:hypothetical protein
VANQFANRIDRDSTLAYYGFGGWRPGSSIPILLLFILGMNALVYWGLLPARSRLRLEEEEGEGGKGAGSSTKGGALDFLRASAEEGKDERDCSSLRRPLLPLPLPTVAPEAAAAAAAGKQPPQQQGGLRQKLLAADEKDLSIPQVLLESLTGTSDSALIDSRLNDGHWSQPSLLQGQSQPHPYGHQQQPPEPQPQQLDVKDYESRSTHIQKSRGIRLLFRDLVYSIPASEPGDDQRGPLLRCLLSSRGKRKNKQQERRVLLKGASGRVNPGEMCALMGGSGAGTCDAVCVRCEV